jgi:hypothetical protein
MARRKSSKGKQSKKKPLRPKLIIKTVTNREKFWRGVRFLLGAVSFLSVVAGVLTLIPRVSLGTSGSLNPAFPMKTVFALSNDGLLPIYDVTAICDMKNVGTQYPGVLLLFQGVAFDLPQSHIDTLSPNQQASLPCNQILGKAEQAVNAEMTINVTYKPTLAWWHRQVSFHLKAEKGEDGLWVWEKIPQ